MTTRRHDPQPHSPTNSVPPVDDSPLPDPIGAQRETTRLPQSSTSAADLHGTATGAVSADSAAGIDQVPMASEAAANGGRAGSTDTSTAGMAGAQSAGKSADSAEASRKSSRSSRRSHASHDGGNKVKGSVAGSTWVALIVGAILLILLLVFILQNQQPTELKMFAWEMEFPAGVGMLIAAIIGALVMALVGGVRMVQLRKQVRQAGKN